MKCTKLITRDHVILRRGLDILERMVQIMEEGGRIEIFDIKAVLTFLRRFGDQHHGTMEEKVLFPVLLRTVPQEGALHQMLIEHRAERELLAAIEDALNPKHGIGFVRNSRQLILLLRNHVDKEKNVLCGIAERLLSAEEDEAIAAEFTTSPTHSENYANFARLERKYAPNRRGTPIGPERRAHA
jgi:hemerythrin-like domain-containing protein